MKTKSVSILFAAALALISLSAGCTMDNKDKVIARTNAIYKNIKLIVTDPEIKPLISDDATTALIEAERAYLEAVQLLESSTLDTDDGRSALSTIVNCADTLLTVIDGLNICGQYEPVITAARLSVGLLKNNLPE